MTKGYVMDAKKLQKLSIGDVVYFDKQWCVLSQFLDGEWQLYTIETEPQERKAREFGIEVFAASAKIHGNAPKPKPITRLFDIMDTVFIVFMEYVGNRQQPVIDWGYLVYAWPDYEKDKTDNPSPRMLLLNKHQTKYIESSPERPVYRVFTFDDMLIKNDKL